MEKTYSLADISFMILLAVIELEGFATHEHIYFVKDVGKGMDGLQYIDSQETLEELLENCDDKFLNMLVVDSSQDRSNELNMGALYVDEQAQLPNPLGGPGNVLSVS